jgi:hypothetical protein
MTRREIRIDFGGLLDRIRTRLKRRGIDLEVPDELEVVSDDEKEQKVRVVCVASDLKESVEAMGQTARDQVIMVRVDESTLKDLDSWVATGAVKSRSEAAAVFIREGLNVRAKELEQLRGALADVEEAQARLKARAREILGDEK